MLSCQTAATFQRIMSNNPPGIRSLEPVISREFKEERPQPQRAFLDDGLLLLAAFFNGQPPLSLTLHGASPLKELFGGPSALAEVCPAVTGLTLDCSCKGHVVWPNQFSWLEVEGQGLQASYCIQNPHLDEREH